MMLFGNDIIPVKKGRNKISEPGRTMGSKRGIEAIKHDCPFCGHHKAFYKRSRGGFECTLCKKIDFTNKILNRKIVNSFMKKRRKKLYE